MHTHTHTHEKQVSGLVPRYVLPPSSRYVDVCKLDSDVHALIKELAIRRIKHRLEICSKKSQHLAEGTKVARLRRRFSFILQQALLFCTRQHRCGQGVALAGIQQPRSQGSVSIYSQCTEGVTGSDEREGANGVGGGDGDRSGDRDREVAGTGTRVGASERTQDGNGAGTGMGTRVEIKGRTQDGNGGWSGGENESSSGDGNGNGDGIGDGKGNENGE